MIALQARADAIRAAWRAAPESPDTHAVLGRDPELAGVKSIVVDLALEEFMIRRQRGERIDPDEFCDRFPQHQASLRQILSAELFLEQNLEALDLGEPAWPAAGDTLGTFGLVRQLGRGGFSRAFLARDAATARDVVVKLTPEGFAEARMMGQFDHPGVVPVLSAHAIPERRLTAVVMPYLGPATLTDLFDAVTAGRPAGARAILDAAAAAGAKDDPHPALTPAPCRAAGSYDRGVARLLRDAAVALAYLHARGVRHGDLKPSNVLLGTDGRARLMDFNLAVDGNSLRLGGTLPYMAPEQIRAVALRRDDVLDDRTDLYSLGAIGFELLTGQHPFDEAPHRAASGLLAPSERAVWLLGRQHRLPHGVREFAPGCDHTLARLVERCLEYDPARRPASAAELVGELDRWLGRPARWHRRLARATAAAALVLLLGESAALARHLTFAAAPQATQEEGTTALADGDTDRAIAVFDRLIAANPDDADAHLGRGKAWLKRNDPGSAENDFVAAAKLAPNGPARSLAAYCLTRNQHHRAAVQYATLAEKDGRSSAALFNNRGVSLTQLGPNQFAAAEADFATAAALAPGNLTVRYNLALLAQARMDQKLLPVLPASALDDIQAAADRPDAPMEVLRTAARMFGAAGQLRTALGYLNRAVAAGLSPKKLSGDPAFEGLKDDPEYVKLLAVDPGPVAPADDPRLILPDDGR